jgi:phosphate transport system substrate-binding protein
MKKILTVALALTVAAGAFAQDWSGLTKDKDGLVAVNVAKVKGNVVVAGSGTIFPLGSAIIEQFKSEGFKDQATYDNIGSGAGFKRFVAGETDIASASVEMDAANKTAVAALKKGDLQEYKISLDALVILVNGKNVALKDLTDKQVQALFSTAVKWSDVDATWPAETINRYIPETSHGTFAYFIEKFFAKKADPINAASNVQRFQDYNQLIAAIEKDKNGIGFIGYDYFKESDNTKAVTLNGVAPTKENVLGAKYGLARYLYLYTTTGIVQSKPQVAAFLGFFLNNANRYTAKLGFFSLPKADLDVQKKLLAETVKASIK